MLSAIVTDVAGEAAIAGGNLADANGYVYGAFSTVGGQGTFTAQLSWEQVNKAQTISFAPGGGARAVTITFFDNGGGRVSTTLDVPLSCGNAQATTCKGVCVTLSNDSMNCGACGNALGGNAICQNGAAACSPGLMLCDGNQCLASDINNCGACGNNCMTWATANHLRSPICLRSESVCLGDADSMNASLTCTDICGSLMCHDGVAFYGPSGALGSNVALGCSSKPAPQYNNQPYSGTGCSCQ
jgi:hypothetical protein